MKIFSQSVKAHALAAALVFAIAAGAELWLGRLLICECPGNSQHLADWYSFSHIIHGFLFYGFLHLVARKLPVRTRLVLALIIEAVWEVLENSPIIINRYRAATIALDYVGDSVINSMMDIAFTALGFWVARKIKLWHSVALIILMEGFVGYVVRDNLTLNIIMLIYPSEAIKTWQMGAP